MASVLAIAHHLGYPIVEVPVRWIDDADSKVTLLQGARAFLEPLRVRVGLLLGQYDEPPLPVQADDQVPADELGGHAT